mmetsp:Transcript_5527/g.11367  ORF Transcript_5527/g.11367 Transcript_5527/m.11367 type:complete len:108 (-) Transcript_5527:468-791(-)
MSSEETSSSLQVTAEPPAPKPQPRLLCRRCKEHFYPSENNSQACAFHTESWSGETAQRWLEPGDIKDGGVQHWFWTCCGAPNADSLGCARGRHATYDEEPGVLYSQQ